MKRNPRRRAVGRMITAPLEKKGAEAGHEIVRAATVH